jgi:hypothetical protein
MKTQELNAACQSTHGLMIACATLCVLLFSLATPALIHAETPTTAVTSESIIFAVRQPGRGGHWYENFGYSAFDEEIKLYGSLGKLCRLDLATNELTTLLDDPDGAVRDPQVHYDGLKILFSYRPGGSDYFHLYEMGVDGRNLTQLTSGPFDDIEPTYLPDGGIMLCSSRCRRWVNCWYSQVAILYACDANGRNMTPISANIEQDNTPWPMRDGRVLYTRWEYVDRSRVAFHHLWTANPDGTGQTIFYGNLHPGTLMIDAKPLPSGDGRVVAIFSPGHGKSEHAGALTIVTPKQGPDDQGAVVTINAEPIFRDPYPISDERFLVAADSRILEMNAEGETRELYRLPKELSDAGAICHEPRPLRARPREPSIPSRIDANSNVGRLVLQNVYEGRRMEGVESGDIRSLLVLETLPKPANFSGKMPPMSFGGTYTLERILGTIPVEEDGSAFMELPALRPLFFVALDEKGNSVKRMHSFLTVMPGETMSCVGCHEQRTQTPATPPSANSLLALQREPSRIQPIAHVPEVVDFPRDVQPILDRHCVECHDYDRREGEVILTGDRGPIYSHAYFTLTALEYVSDGRDRLVTNMSPRSVGTSASPLMDLLDGSHYDAKLTPEETDVIRYWIESAAAYPGTYAALDTGMVGGFPYSKLDTSDRAWPSSIAAAETIERRCEACHDRERPLPRYLSDNLGFTLSNPNFSDIRVRNSRHLMFNLTRPELSLILLAPLAKASGGYGLCSDSPIFADTEDPDYQCLLALCRDGRTFLDENPRFDMPGFTPSEPYLREMRRFGVLSETTDPSTIDVYQLDEAYWRLFHRE